MQLMQKGQFRKMRNKIATFFSRSKPDLDIIIRKPKQKDLDKALVDECYNIVKYNDTKSNMSDTKKIMRLLNAGANPNAKDSDGMTPLIIAAWGGDRKIVNAMLALGAEIDAQDNHKMTALMLAAQRGHPRTVKALVAKGADVNMLAECNKTALMLAAERGRTKICKLLLDNGASPNAFDSYRRTARMLAIRNKQPKTEALLSRAETRIFESIMGKKGLNLFMHGFRECVA